MTAEINSWDELCLIGIKNEEDANEVQFAAFTEDISALPTEEKQIEGKILVNGGRIVKKTGMTDKEITFKCIPVSVGRDGRGGLATYLAGTAGTADPYSAINTNKWRVNRVVLLWANNLPTTAAAAITAGNEARRFTIVNAYCTKIEWSYDDKELVAEVTFKWTPFNKTAVSNDQWQYTDGTTGLDAVAATPTSANAQWG